MPATPARIESELYAAAMSAGEVMGRSAAQQINHWHGSAASSRRAAA